MKRTTRIFKSIIPIAAVTIFVACKKDIEQPPKDLKRDSIEEISSKGSTTWDVAARAKPTTSNGYAGNSTLGDSTKSGN